MDSHGAVLILEDLPDSCRANLLLKKCVASLFEDYPDVLYFIGSQCCGHILHNRIVAMFGEVEVVGHVHAIQHVLSITSRREILLKALYMLIARDLIAEAGPPPEELLRHRDHVVKQTFMRRSNVVSARCSGNIEVDWADLSSDAVMNAMPAYHHGEWQPQAA